MATCSFCGYIVTDSDSPEFCHNCRNPIMDYKSIDRCSSDGRASTFKAVIVGSVALCFLALITLGTIPGIFIWPALEPICWLLNKGIAGESNFNILLIISFLWPLSIVIGYLLTKTTKSKTKKIIIFISTIYSWLVILFLISCKYHGQL
jgi:hypothetical protein